MISIAQYELSCNGDTTKILSKESSLCPICGGALKVHGTCTRKVRYGDCIHKYHLRVLKCQCCGKTHRELPDSLIPYKRYGVEAFCEIAESTEARHTCETSTWLRIRSWLAWFICYAQNIATGLIAPRLHSAPADGAFCPAGSKQRKLDTAPFRHDNGFSSGYTGVMPIKQEAIPAWK